MSSVRHIAPAAEAQLVALGEFQHKVAVWALDPPRLLAAFTTILDFGGRRLALDREGRACFAAAYSIHGLACYEAGSGTTRWSRRDLKRIQRLRPTTDGTGLYAFFDQGPGQLLDAVDGRTVGRLRGVRNIVESPFAPVDLFETARLELRTRNGDLRTTLNRSTFAMLSATFSPSHVAVSESTGPVRWVELETGEEVWRYVPRSGSHVLKVGYSGSAGGFFGVEWPYKHGGPKTLLRFDLEEKSGSVVALLGSPAEAVFCARGERLLTSDGILFQVPTGSAREIGL